LHNIIVETYQTMEELEKYWDRFSSTFDKNFTATTTLFGQQLMVMLPLRDPKVSKVLEVGCGSGQGTVNLMRSKGDHVHLTSTDLSKEMIKIASDRIKVPTVTFEVANGAQLQYQDGEFDAYYANFVLHLVPSAADFAREARRVVKKGGVAAFSVWGRKENGAQFTLPAKAWADLGLAEQSTSRSHFYLGDLESTRKILLDAGFSKVLAWYSWAPLDALSGEEFAQRSMEGPAVVDKLKTLTPEQGAAYKKRLTELAEEHMATGTPIGYESLMLIAIA
jgi:ubiquinone/menaquinone biosynthesis C-methylase UbiE